MDAHSLCPRDTPRGGQTVDRVRRTEDVSPRFIVFIIPDSSAKERRMAFLYCLELLLFVIGTSLAAICPLGWYRHGESCYHFISQSTWEQANVTCAEMHSTLAVPRSEMEQSFVWGMYLSLCDGEPSQSLFIGCNDIEEEGNWKGCQLRDDDEGYENWRDEKPDSDENEDCGIMDRNHDGKWSNRGCSQKRSAVCQQPADSSSTPAYCLRTGSDGRISSRCLVGHVVKELPADGVVSCGKACRLEPRCRSFNLLDQGGRDEKMTCQLNNVTSDGANKGNWSGMVNCYLFDI